MPAGDGGLRRNARRKFVGGTPTIRVGTDWGAAGPGQRRDSFGGHIGALELNRKLATLLQTLDVEVPDALKQS